MTMPMSLRVVDSITELKPADAGCIAVSGSHGGISSARYALAARPLLSVFNDAGVGRDEAGIAALALLQSQGLAACTVSHRSARIGDARNTLDDGIVGHLNEAAAVLGVRAGRPLREAVAILQLSSRKQA
ncbi:MAG: hypothetical protein ABWZ88_12715 [Variovorax sp.]